MRSKVWLGGLISAVFIWLAFRKIDFNALLAGLSEADYIYLLPAVLIHIAQIYLRSMRWGYLIEPVKKVGRYSLFSATAIGHMANNILPVRIGELVKAVTLGRQEKISISASFATIVVERLLDVFTLFIFMLFTLYAVNLPYGSRDIKVALEQGGGVVSLVFIFMLALLFYFKNNIELFKNFANRVTRLLSRKAADKMAHCLDAFVSGLSVLKRGRHLLPIAFYSLFIWFLCAVPIYLTLLSFGHGLPFSVSLFILIILAFTVAVPSAPGFIGTFHYACAMALRLFDIPGEEALSVAILLHAINFFPVTLIGLYFLWRNKMSLKEIEAAEEIQ